MDASTHLPAIESDGTVSVICYANVGTLVGIKDGCFFYYDMANGLWKSMADGAVSAQYTFNSSASDLGLTGGQVYTTAQNKGSDGKYISRLLTGNYTIGAAVSASDHTGGTATCTNKAVCSTCGREYGKTIQSENYGLTSSGTGFTLKPAYLKTLSVGNHTLKAVFEDGYGEASIATISNTSPTTVDNGSPATADNNFLWLYLLLAITTGGGLTFLTISRRVSR